MDLFKPCPCVVCNKLCTKRCATCQSVYYCSEFCQTKHWPIHIQRCKQIPYDFYIGSSIKLTDGRRIDMQPELKVKYIMDNLEQRLKKAQKKEKTAKIAKIQRVIEFIKDVSITLIIYRHKSPEYEKLDRKYMNMPSKGIFVLAVYAQKHEKKKSETGVDIQGYKISINSIDLAIDDLIDLSSKQISDFKSAIKEAQSKPTTTSSSSTSSSPDVIPSVPAISEKKKETKFYVFKEYVPLDTILPSEEVRLEFAKQAEINKAATMKRKLSEAVVSLPSSKEPSSAVVIAPAAAIPPPPAVVVTSIPAAAEPSTPRRIQPKIISPAVVVVTPADIPPPPPKSSPPLEESLNAPSPPAAKKIKQTNIVNYYVYPLIRLMNIPTDTIKNLLESLSIGTEGNVVFKEVQNPFEDENPTIIISTDTRQKDVNMKDVFSWYPMIHKLRKARSVLLFLRLGPKAEEDRPTLSILQFENISIAIATYLMEDVFPHNMAIKFIILDYLLPKK